MGGIPGKGKAERTILYSITNGVVLGRFLQYWYISSLRIGKPIETVIMFVFELPFDCHPSSMADWQYNYKECHFRLAFLWVHTKMRKDTKRHEKTRKDSKRQDTIHIDKICFI